MRLAKAITAVDAHAASMHRRVALGGVGCPARPGPYDVRMEQSEYVLAADDPFPEGFTVGDVWPS